MSDSEPKKPDSGRKKPVALRSTSERYQKKGDSQRVNGTHVNVAPNGWPVDGKEQDNIEQFGYPCPRDHFIFGSPDLTTADVARVWGLKSQLVAQWARDNQWQKHRSTVLAKRPASQGGEIETQKVLDARERFIEESLADYEEMRGTLMDEHRRSTEQKVSPSGEVVETRKNAGTRRAEIAARRDIDEAMSIKLGLPTKSTGQYAGATVNNNLVKQTVINAPAGAPSVSTVEDACPPALPDGETVEGEVES